MKRLTSCLLILFSIFFSCFSEIKFSIAPLLSTTMGKYGEYVYSWSGKSIVSYLEWQQLPLFKAGAKAEFTFNNFSFSSSFFYGLPIQCGKMYDSDWGAKAVKTSYSISKNNGIQNYDFSCSISYKIKIKQFSLSPELSYSYYYDFFKSSDGEGWYGSENYSKNGKEVSWDSSYARHYKKLSQIELKRESRYFFAGLKFNIPLGTKIEISLGSFFAPYAYVYNSDHHLDDNGTNKDFYLTSFQEMFFSRFLEKVCLTYKINQNFIIPFNIECILGDIEKGMLEGYEQYGGTDVVQFFIKTGIQYIF